MRDKEKIITVVGGSGFLGRHTVQTLAEQGYTIQVLCRDTENANVVKPAGNVGQIVVRYADLAKPETFDGLLNGSYAVINLVGIAYQKGRQKFTTLHSKGAEKLAQMAKEAGVKKFIQVSALGIEKASSSKYAHTKLLGEKAVQGAFPTATILRPSILFGADDEFFNMFARMSRISPALPAIGGGKSQFQPVYVHDVARAISVVLVDDNTQGKTYELGGPKTYSFAELLKYCREQAGQCACVMHVPSFVASIGASFAELMPKPMLTRDQVRLLKYDSIVSDKAHTLEDLGIPATPLEQIVPDYLEYYRAA